jgi:hypothetical protein
MFLFHRKPDIVMGDKQYEEILKYIRKKEASKKKHQHHRKLTQRQIKQLIITLAIFILLTVANATISLISYIQKPKIIEKEIIKMRHLTGLDINNEIKWYFDHGYSDTVYKWYQDYIGNRDNTIAIINSALLHGIPIHKSIAQTFVESQFRSDAIGHNYDKNGNLRSIDIGLKQGNQYTFPHDPLNKMLDPYYNLSRCDAYFRTQYEKYHDWNRAAIAYNRGKILDENGFKYLANVLSYENYLDEQFNLYFPII